MIYTSKEVRNKYLDYYNINKAIANKEIYKIDHGVYSDEEHPNMLVVACLKHVNAIITLNSAFYFYGLTNKEPEKVYLATTRNSDKINDSYVYQMSMEKKLLNIGKTQFIIDGKVINIYDKERLLIELVRKKWLLPQNYYRKVITNYRKISSELDMKKLEEYIPNFYNGEHILKRIINEIF